MAEYIERKSIKYEQWPVGPLYEPIMVVRKKTIDKIPAADVAPVRHGKWLHHTMIDGHIHAECSECHKVRIIDNYCPNCGALMDGDNDA